MRNPLAASAILFLSGCASSANTGAALSESRFPAPPRSTVMAKKPAEMKPSPVEDWTKKQRRCEVGDKDDQRRCIMPYPGS